MINCGHVIGCGHVISYNHMISYGHVINCGHVTSYGHVISCGHVINCGHVTSYGHVIGCATQIIYQNMNLSHCGTLLVKIANLSFKRIITTDILIAMMPLSSVTTDTV